MAIALINKNYNTQICRFACDSTSELDYLPNATRGSTLSGRPELAVPCSIGSTAVVKDGGSVVGYTLFTSGWIKGSVMSGGSGGGTGSGESFVPSEEYTATDEEILDIFS